MNENAQKVMDRILKSFESGEVAEEIAITALMEEDRPCAKWSLLNRLTMLYAGTQDARGFQQWKKAERHVRKGAKAFYILAPMLKKQRNVQGEEEEVLVGFTPVPVFRYEDTTGKPLEYPELEPKELPPLYDVASAWGIEVSWERFDGWSYGAYRPKPEKIRLASHDEMVFLHELAHAAHFRSRGSLKPGQDPAQEIVAELTACVLAHLFGKRPNDGHTYQYIKWYAKRQKVDVHYACVSVIRQVEACLNLIIRAKHRVGVEAA